MIVLIIIAVFTAVMGIVILIGKGDMLIAGYNTASKKEREKYHIGRLRLLCGGVLIAITPLLCLLTKDDSLTSVFAFSATTVILAIIVIVLANTWAKKKTK